MTDGQPSEFSIALEQTPAPEASLSLEAQLLDALIETGATFPDAAGALRAIETVLDVAGDQRAAEALGFVFARLPGGKHGQELRAALNLSMDCDGVELARQNRETKQAWHQRIDRLRRRIFKKR